MRTSPAAALCIVTLSACGGAPPTTVDGAASEPTAHSSAAAGASTTLAADPVETAQAAPSATPRAAGVPAADSWPERVTPLSEAEGAELGKKCKPFTDAVAVAAKKAGRSKGSADIARDVLKDPPKVPGVDSARCADLMRRDLIAYRARTIEQEGVVGLKRIALGMANHFAEAHGLCPSAPPVPGAHWEVKDAPYLSKAEEWKDVGWACLRFDQQGPQRFSYEVKVDVANATYEAIARGYPVEGAPPTELYVRVEIDESGPPLNVEVMRRKVP